MGANMIGLALSKLLMSREPLADFARNGRG